MSDDRKEFILAALRGASLRAKLLETEINSIGVALKGDIIDGYTAMQWVKDIGALEFMSHILPEETAEIPSTTD